MKIYKIAAWITALMAVLVTGYGCGTMKQKITVSTVEHDIQTHLPIGSTKADVIAFLDQRKIPHGWYQGSAQISPDGRVTVPNTHTEVAVIRNVRKEGLITTDINIFFKFDQSDSKLVNFSVQEVYTGP